MRGMRLFYLAGMALFSIGPIGVILAVSVTASRRMVFPPDQVSFRWFAEIFVDDGWFAALTNSVVIALASALLAVAVALPVVYVAWRRGWRLARTLLALGLAPFILPPIIISVGFLVLFSSLGVEGHLLNAVVAHSIYVLAVPLVVLSIGLAAVERPILEASATLGASDAQVFRTIILPMMTPYVCTAFAFCVVLSLNEYIIALMTIGFTHETIPIKIYNALRYGYSPVLAAVAVLFMGLNVLIFGLVAVFADLPKLLGAYDR